jgi:hypothetical protein
VVTNKNKVGGTKVMGKSYKDDRLDWSYSEKRIKNQAKPNFRARKKNMLSKIKHMPIEAIEGFEEEEFNEVA